ncbi:MAG: hypothetical protein JW841_18485 [Deltaproteobacteria bacterium]|nr:hypothetical protein [Deltaproteobacteria bacterium]
MPLDIKTIQSAEQAHLQQEAQAREEAQERLQEAARHQGKQQQSDEDDTEPEQKSVKYQRQQAKQSGLEQATNAAHKARAGWQHTTGRQNVTSNIMAAEQAEEAGFDFSTTTTKIPSEKNQSTTTADITFGTNATKDFNEDVTDEFFESDLKQKANIKGQDDKYDNRTKTYNAASVDDYLQSAKPLNNTEQNNFIKRISDTIFMFSDGLAWCFKGLRRGLHESKTSLAKGIDVLGSGNSKVGFNQIGAGFTNFFLNFINLGITIFATSWYAFINIFLSKPARKLKPSEIACLRSVFANSINYNVIRLREIDAPINESLPGKTFENNIYIYISAFDDGIILPHILVSLAMRIWQFQVGCSDFILQTIIERFKYGSAHAWEGDVPSTPFAKLSMQQQVSLIQSAQLSGYFTAYDPNQGVFRINLTNDGSPTDLTEYLQDATQLLRTRKKI